MQRRPSRVAVRPDHPADSSDEESAYTAAGDSSGVNRLYLQLVLYAGGNVAAIAVGLVLWNLWSILSAFR